jgi:predicted esterase
MPRFFRRLAEGIFYEEDLIRRTNELADFVPAAQEQHGLADRKVVAVGYSNGANIAASMLLLRPEILDGAVLFRAMVPLHPVKLPELTARPVLMLSGRSDPIISPQNAEELAAMLAKAGADVELRWNEGGHQLSSPEIADAQKWISRHFSP